MDTNLSGGRQSAAKNLASALPFQLGPLAIDPASRRVGVIGRTEMLEPRVMRVLVALGEASGGVVTRDDLIELCWDGQIVTDNAITRVISLLRHALNDLAGDAVQLETIAKVGYRLLVAHTDDRVIIPVEATAATPPVSPAVLKQRPTSAPDTPLPRPEASGGRGLSALHMGVILLLSLSILAGGIAFSWFNGNVGFDAPIEVEAFASDSSSNSNPLVSIVRAELMDVLDRSRIATTGSKSQTWLKLARPASRILRAQVTERNGQAQIAVYFSDSASGTTLWSQRFSGPTEELNHLAFEAAAATVRTVYTAHDLDLQKGLSLSPEAVALYLEGNSALRNPQLLREGVPRQIFANLVAQAPDSAAAQGLLALALTHEALLARPGERRALLARSRVEAHQAIAKSPAAAGAAFDALSLASRVEHPDRYAEAERWLIAGLRQAPAFAFVAMRECRTLLEVGRAREALLQCQRALALHPYAEPIEWTYAEALSMIGRGPQAIQSIERTASHSPEHLMTRRTLLSIWLFEGNPQRARAILRDAGAQPAELSEEAAAILDRVLAEKGAAGASVDLPGKIVTARRSGIIPFDLAVMALASLGRKDEAFALIDDGSVEELYGKGTFYLFRPVAAPLRADPRFWAVAARLGLARYWITKQEWPDFCGQEIALARCKLEATQAFRLASAH